MLQGSSPDELALVTLGERLGFRIIEFNNDILKLGVGNEQNREYKVLEMIPFSSERKSMTIVLSCSRCSCVLILTKGADSKIRELVSENERIFIDEKADELARKGLRTLVYAIKKMPHEQYSREKEMVARVSDGRAFTRQLVDSLEKDSKFLFITAVEDLLQRDVKMTIHMIKEGNIKPWMLTGDKLETAICISTSTGFKNIGQDCFILDSCSDSDILKKISSYNRRDLIVVTGTSLEVVFGNDQLCTDFFKIAILSPSVIFCRCSPKQKADIAIYLKDRLKKIVLCIGDGGNDVAMIQSANLGIGIEGVEGKQASQASDISVNEFCSLQRLLFWYGRMNVARVSKITMMICYRTFLLFFTQLIFQLFFFPTTSKIFDPWLIVLLNTNMTLWTIIALVFDIDITENQAREYPNLYILSQRNRLLSFKNFIFWISFAYVQALIIYFFNFHSLWISKENMNIIISIAISLVITVTSFLAFRRYNKFVYILFILNLINIVGSMVFLHLVKYLNLTEKALKLSLLLSLILILPFLVLHSIKRSKKTSHLDKLFLENKLSSIRSKS